MAGKRDGGASSSGSSTGGSSTGSTSGSSTGSTNASSTGRPGASDSGDGGASSSSSDFSAFEGAHSVGFNRSTRPTVSAWRPKLVQRIVATLAGKGSKFPTKVYVIRVRRINNVIRHFFFKLVSGGRRKHADKVLNIAVTLTLSAVGGDVGRATKGIRKGKRHLQRANADHDAEWRELVMDRLTDHGDFEYNSALMHMAAQSDKIRCCGYLDQYTNSLDFSINLQPGDDEDFYRFFLELVDRPAGVEPETPGAHPYVGTYSIDNDSVTLDGGKVYELVDFPDPGTIDKALKKIHKYMDSANTYLDENQ